MPVYIQIEMTSCQCPSICSSICQMCMLTCVAFLLFYNNNLRVCSVVFNFPVFSFGVF